MKKIKKWYRGIQDKRKFQRDMVEWVKLCRIKKTSRSYGICKIGELTHKINIDGNVVETSMDNPIFIKAGE